jgi:CBS-domain-containing membrane protein
VVYSVLPNAPVTEVVNQLVGLKVHRLFVVDENGVLVGVISMMDVLRQLRPENESSASDEEFAPHVSER